MDAEEKIEKGPIEISREMSLLKIDKTLDPIIQILEPCSVTFLSVSHAKMVNHWGCGAVGSALESHSRGRGFESP